MNRQDKIVLLAQYLGPLYLSKNWQIALAESCTGGGIAYQITQYPGSSNWLKYSVVSYTDAAKHELLGVSKEILTKHSSVSFFCAQSMLAGLDSDCARMAVTGYCGPGGDDVGLVYIAYAPPQGAAKVTSFRFLGSRAEIQQQVIFEALKLLVDMAWAWEEEPLHQCFFGFDVEDESTKLAINEQSLNMGFAALNLEPMSNFHLTLAHFSKQTSVDILGLMQNVDLKQGLYTEFNIELTQLIYLERADAWALGIDDAALELQKLATLCGARHFLPHLTISKGCGLKMDFARPSFSILWKVRHFALFLSFHGIFYKVIKMWNLENAHDRKL